ncbi:MAG: hypothetical protein ACXABY_16400, partial [Candidatus Thorarchaeota archaeon]
TLAIPTESGFQFERNHTIATPNRFFFQIKAEDANLSIVFEDRADLLYSIDITSYDDSSEARLRIQIEEDSWGIFLTADRQESVDITLGTGCFYFINIINSSGLNTTITYSNNAWVNGSALTYGVDDSDLTLRILDDIGVNNTTGFIGYIRCKTLNLEIDVSEQWRAYVDFYDSNLTILEMSGWNTSGGEQGYASIPVTLDSHRITLDVHAENAFAKLLA